MIIEITDIYNEVHFIMIDKIVQYKKSGLYTEIILVNNDIIVTELDVDLITSYLQESV